MKIKLGILYNSYIDVASFLNEKFPAKLAFKLGKLYQDMTPIIENFDKVKKESCSKYGGVVKESENSYKFEDKDKEAECIKELDDLFSEEIELDFSPISINDLDGLSIEPSKLITKLSWIICE